MNMYDPQLRVFEIDRLPDGQYVMIEGIPPGVERFDTVKLTTKYPRLMYPACVVDLCEDNNFLWLSFDRLGSLWA